jgi:hypothetical protein
LRAVKPSAAPKLTRIATSATRMTSRTTEFPFDAAGALCGSGFSRDSLV